MTVVLTHDEIAELDRQHPSTRGKGGWQSLIVHLQIKVDRRTGRLSLDSGDLKRIARYAFAYGRGGWEKRLQRIFSRTLGPALGRQKRHAA
jgi:hypothetical protein